MVVSEEGNKNKEYRSEILLFYIIQILILLNCLRTHSKFHKHFLLEIKNEFARKK